MTNEEKQQIRIHTQSYIMWLSFVVRRMWKRHANPGLRQTARRVEQMAVDVSNELRNDETTCVCVHHYWTKAYRLDYAQDYEASSGET